MPDHPTSLMLFAAGRGTRMGPLTAERPKPLIPVAGRPLIDHALALVRDAKVAKVVANVHYLADMVTEHLQGVPVEISDERDHLLETGGGLRQALPLLGGGPVFTLNTDAVWTGENPLVQLCAAWRPDRMDGLLLLADPAPGASHAGKGDFLIAANGHLQRGPGLIYTGAQIIRTELLAEIADQAFSLNRLWDLLLRRGRLCGVVHRGGWCDVGSPAGIVAAEAMLEDARDV